MLNSQDYHRADEARDLIYKIKNDKDLNYSLIDRANVQKLRLWYIKALCNRNSLRDNGASYLTVKDFIKLVEADLPMI